MKRVLLVAAVALASSFAVAPASAAGDCDQKIEVGCNQSPCVPDYPCTPRPCVVYYSGKCLLGSQ